MEVVGYVGIMGLLIAWTWKKHPDYSKPDKVTLKGVMHTIGAVLFVCLGIVVIHAL
ncbi:MAG: hypothetical protein M0R06_12860 [Sphaerochaeta sp.]|jgi:HD-like signal output (HDOD) protein|nr:hypothetical protein [Sphaerochaeta sp.]